MTNPSILILPGDGIGPEVMKEVRKVIDWYGTKLGLVFDVSEDLVGGIAYDTHGTPLHDSTLAKAQEVDAVLLGAVGGPDYDNLDFSLKPERGLLKLRKEMDLFANLRPAQCFNALAEFSSLKTEVVSGLDIMIVRELTSGIYFGEPRGIIEEGNERVGINTQRYTESEIDRVARSAFELARRRGNKVCSMEKANVMESGVLWREVVQKVHDEDYQDVELSHMYADAGAMQSSGQLYKGADGKPWIRLNWNKRYITLAAISTLLGLAFKLSDPDNILGQGQDLGITCALIPTDTPGVVIGRRHNPLNVPFYNCPTSGVNVEVSLDAVIGGRDGVGQGWKMLMECLSAGRGISLPANCSGGSKQLLRVVSAYSAIRKQFGLPIGKFEGIQEKLAEIVGVTYLLEATRRYTCGGLDSGAKPAVVTAIAKYNFTELYRKILNHGMDIQAGAAISLGPRNLLAHAYFAAPISITVEGANILTRTLMVFGQGAIRCHPYVLGQINALETNNLSLFNTAFWGHVGHVIRNSIRLGWLSLTRGYLVLTPGGPMRRYYQKLSWASVQFAVFADLAMLTLGGDLKRKEQLTGRFADILSWMYMATAVLRRFEYEKRPKQTRSVAEWSLSYAFSHIQVAFDLIFQNMGIVTYLHRFVSRFNPISQPPADSLTQKIAAQIQEVDGIRNEFFQGIRQLTQSDAYQTQLEAAFRAVKESEVIYQKVKKAVRKGVIKKGPMPTMIQAALDLSVISNSESEQLTESERLAVEAIKVDDFSQEEYLR